jgi:cytochrome c peroxidase
MRDTSFKIAGATLTLLAFGTSFALAADDYPPLATLPPPSIPADNPMSPEKVELGKKLFWDGRLSGNGTMGCVACHLPDQGWGTGSPISFGYPGTQHWRNSQTVLNSAYYNKLFFEGSTTSLEGQGPDAAEGGVAGNGDPAMMEMRLRFVPDYVKAFKDVFGTEWPNYDQAWLAVAAFERTIVTDAKKVPFDRFLAGDNAAMSDQAKRGMELFNGKAGCLSCHNGSLVSDQKFYNTSVPTAPDFTADPLFQITLRWELYQKGVPEIEYRDGALDLGLYHVTKRPDDKGKFRTSSLRELRWTGPFMHNGVHETIAQVVDFYNEGGGQGQTAGLKPLGLNETEKADLVAFLEALSMDEPLLMDEPVLPKTANWSEFPQ